MTRETILRSCLCEHVIVLAPERLVKCIDPDSFEMVIHSTRVGIGVVHHLFKLVERRSYHVLWKQWQDHQ